MGHRSPILATSVFDQLEQWLHREYRMQCDRVKQLPEPNPLPILPAVDTVQGRERSFVKRKRGKKRLRVSCVLGLVVFINCSSVAQPSASGKESPAKNVATEATGAGLRHEREQALKSLGYFARTEAVNPKKRAVTKDTSPAFDGVNLYNSRHRASALLLDMGGKVLHEWRAPNAKPPWMHTVLMRNGDLLVISKGHYVARLDWNSNVVWRRSMGAHHDLTVGPEGNIYVLTHRVIWHRHRGVAIPIMDDQIVILSPDGEILKKRSLFPVLGPLVSEGRLNRIKRLTEDGVSTAKLIREGAPADTTHTNSIQVLRRSIASIASVGSILLSVREIDRIVIINEGMDKVLWSWGRGELEGQHHATLLENGNITIFDNGVNRKRSRVLEMNPMTGQIVWSYAHPDFYSRLRGSAQLLPNGNMLATESDKGHAFEITRKGKRVWEFWNPDVRKGNPPTRGVIYRLTRYPMDYLASGLLGAKK